MTTPQMAGTVRARYAKAKREHVRVEWISLLREVVMENGFRTDDEIRTKTSEVARECARQKKHWVGSWGRKAS